MLLCLHVCVRVQCGQEGGRECFFSEKELEKPDEIIRELSYCYMRPKPTKKLPHGGYLFIFPLKFHSQHGAL